MTREPKPGDYVEVQTSDDLVKGVLLQSPELEKDIVIIKLDSGYNLGIDRKNVKEIILGAQKAVPHKETTAKKAPTNDKNLPKISILHTGGTIASKVDYKTGGVIANYSPEEMLAFFPELKQIASVNSRQIMRLQSEMIRFPHYNIMAKEIEAEAKKGVDGIIITHGTDTMHYSSAAISFMLENLGIPVMFVGSQRSSDRGSSDAGLNVISAAYFIANSDFSGVGICMHENLNDNTCLVLPGLKTRKMHTTRRDAFRPINAQAVARVDFENKSVSFFSKSYSKRDKSKKITIKPINEKLKVGIIKTHTNMFASQFLAFKGFDGLVIEATALGHIPNEKIDEHTAENEKIFKAVKELIDSGVVVVDSSQSIYGRIQLDVYTPLREIKSIGVLGHLSDMTPETTFIKLVWLLSNYKPNEAKELIEKNLRGEISERTEEKNFMN